MVFEQERLERLGYKQELRRSLSFIDLNPVTGPFHVDGAEPGGTLAPHFVDVAPARDWAVTTPLPHFGTLTGTHTTATLPDPVGNVVDPNYSMAAKVTKPYLGDPTVYGGVYDQLRTLGVRYLAER